MFYLAESLSSSALLIVNLLVWPLFAYGLMRTPWQHLRVQSDLHVWLAATVCTMMFWQMRAGIQPGLEFHILGTTLLTLMFGRHFAVLSVTLAALAAVVTGAGTLSTLAISMLLAGLVPAGITWALWQFVESHLPRNLFVYIFVTAFFGAATCVLLVSLLNAGFAIASGAYAPDYLGEYYLPFALLMMFPEAFITGAFITLLVVYRPQWVMTFHDSRYLK